METVFLLGILFRLSDQLHLSAKKKKKKKIISLIILRCKWLKLSCPKTALNVI